MPYELLARQSLELGSGLSDTYFSLQNFQPGGKTSALRLVHLFRKDPEGYAKPIRVAGSGCHAGGLIF